MRPRSLSWMAPENISLLLAENSSISTTRGTSSKLPVPSLSTTEFSRSWRPFVATITLSAGRNSFTIIIAGSM